MCQWQAPLTNRPLLLDEYYYVASSQAQDRATPLHQRAGSPATQILYQKKTFNHIILTLTHQCS